VVLGTFTQPEVAHVVERCSASARASLGDELTVRRETFLQLANAGRKLPESLELFLPLLVHHVPAVGSANHMPVDTSGASERREGDLPVLSFDLSVQVFRMCPVVCVPVARAMARA
jgi:hypothetical protein